MSAEEDRQLFERAEAGTPVVVICDLGVAVVRVAGGRVGEFGIVDRCTPRDVAAATGTVAVATAEDVLVGNEGAIEPTAFGPAVAVGVADGAVIAADPDGRLARLADDWLTIGTVPGAVRAIDPPFVASEAGVFRIGSDGPVDVGLSDARDVAAAGIPRAATVDGLYRLGNGWMVAVEGDFRVVAGREEPPHDRPTAHAATPETVYEERADEWTPIDLPTDDPVVDIAYGVATGALAITETGSVLIEEADGWRSFELGFSGVRGLAVP